MGRGGLRSPLPWLGALLLVYLGGPVAYFLYRFATTQARGFHDAGLFPAFWVSIEGATISTAVVTLAGVPLAYVLARHRGPLTAVLGVWVMLPLALPPVMSGILLVYVLGPYTPIGQFFGGHLTESLTGVVLAQSFVAAPFLVVTARAAFSAVDPTLEEAAKALGHGQLARFFKVQVPVAAPGIRAGMVLTWLRAFGEYGATIVLAYHPSSLNVYTYIQFASSGLPGTVAPTALALGVAAVAVLVSRLVVMRRRSRRRDTGALPAPRHPAAPAPAPLSFDVQWRLGDFRLEIAHRSEALRLAVLGPSGSGKSALLRCVAGLYGRGPGPVSYGDRRVEATAVEHRRIGYVGQGFELFPHLSVWEQVVFARGADPTIGAYWMEALRLTGLERRLPSELSGGQRQRVALAQALARSPDVLFLDEPLSSLDVPVRMELRREIRRLQRETAISSVIVTHDPEEAALLADEIIVVVDGRVLQQGAALDVYERPRSTAVAELLGIRNVFPAVVERGGRLRCATGTVLQASGVDAPPGSAVLWQVRPGDVGASAAPGTAGAGAGGGGGGLAGYAARLDDLSWLGGRIEARVALGAALVLEADGDPLRTLSVGSRLHVSIAPDAVRAWPALTGADQDAESRTPPGS